MIWKCIWEIPMSTILFRIMTTEVYSSGVHVRSSVYERKHVDVGKAAIVNWILMPEVKQTLDRNLMATGHPIDFEFPYKFKRFH